MSMKVTDTRDPLFEDVKKFVQQEKFTSGSRNQSKFSLGFNRAERIVAQPEEAGIISSMKNGQRKVL